MKDVIKFIFQIIFVCICFASTVQLAFLIINIDYPEGNYIMEYRVYYPDNPQIYTVENSYPIYMNSYRGTNEIIKVTKIPYIKKMWGREYVFESSAPIEIVSYKFNGKNLK